MRNQILVLAVLALLGGCSFNRVASGPTQPQVVDYTQSDGNVVLLVVQPQGMDPQKAKQMALQRAAEITVENGYRYFRVVSESETQVVQSQGNGQGNEGYTTNMYQEYTVEGDFGRESVDKRATQGSDVYPAWRCEFEMQRRSRVNSYDACDYTECKKP